MKTAAAAIGVAIAAAVAACGSDPGTLTGGGGGLGDPNGGAPVAGNQGTGGGGNSATPSGGSSGGSSGSSNPSSSAPPPGIQSADAKTYFVQTVYPELLPTCGSCHSAPGSAGAPAYLGSSATDAYATVEARGYIVPSGSSMLVRKGQHEGPALTAQQLTDVSHWLDLEAQVRGNQAPVNLLSKLGNCLDQTKFEAIGLQNLRTIKRTNENANNCTGCNQAPCQACHEQGEYAMHSNFGNLGTQTFQALQQNATSPEGIYIISKYITTNGTQLVPSTALADKAKVTATGPAYSHPMFQVSATMTQAITDFANDAITKYNAKQCGQ